MPPEEIVEGQSESPQSQETPPDVFDASGYKATFKKLRAERDERDKQLKDALKKLEEIESRYKDIDPEQVALLKQQAASQEEDRQRTVEEQARIIADKENLIKQLSEQNVNLKKTSEEQKIVSELRDAFYDADGKKGVGLGNASFFDNILRVASSRVARDENGNLVVLEEGTRRLDYNASTAKPKTLRDLMEELARDEVLGVNFKPRSQASGGGFVQGIKPGQPQLSVDELMKLTPGEMARIGREIRK